MKSTRRKIILLSLMMTIASLNTVAFAGTANRNDNEFLAEKIKLAEQKLSKMEIKRLRNFFVVTIFLFAVMRQVCLSKGVRVTCE